MTPPLDTAALAGGNPGSVIRGPGPNSREEGVGTRQFVCPAGKVGDGRKHGGEVTDLDDS